MNRISKGKFGIKIQHYVINVIAKCRCITFCSADASANEVMNTSKKEIIETRMANLSFNLLVFIVGLLADETTREERKKYHEIIF